MSTEQLIALPPIDHPRLRLFPVRHHSPACARAVKQLIEEWQPDQILIEGPADFNPLLEEFKLPHKLPIAIYSYVTLENNVRRGAFYPFCIYSPEWQAILAAQKGNKKLKFIDLPWEKMVTDAPNTHRYADGPMLRSRYVAQLKQELQVDTYDALWDTLFEIEPLPIDKLQERVHHFCYHLRALEKVDALDIKREAFMMRQIETALNEDEKILVVTGGYHSSGLWARFINNSSTELIEEPSPKIEQKGISLTPYTYERLDNLTGYESGMPSPGFYHQMWQDMETGTVDGHQQLLADIARILRKNKQFVSAADLIAVETTAQAVARIRGHSRVWRTDILDGIIAALVKEELKFGLPHPFLTAVFTLFRGSKRGKLAPNSTLPSLVLNIQKQLEAHDLYPDKRKKFNLETTNEEDRQKSKILHQLRILTIPGFYLPDGVWVSGSNRNEINEQWETLWIPEFEAACIEAAIYGPTLEDATLAKLIESAEKINPPNAELATNLLQDVALAGLQGEMAQQLFLTLQQIITQDDQFFTVAQALPALLFLYRFDTVLGTIREKNIQILLQSCFQRSLWLLDGLGTIVDQEVEILSSMHHLLECWRRCRSELDVTAVEFSTLLKRIAANKEQNSTARGAATGILWSLASMNASELIFLLKQFYAPEKLGDYLTGLFYLTRESVRQEKELLDGIDQFITSYDDEMFLTALPALKLAFSFFTPREKYQMSRRLFPAGTDTPLNLTIDTATATAALAFESTLIKQMKQFQLWSRKDD